mgnify:CR=1 FL=1
MQLYLNAQETKTEMRIFGWSYMAIYNRMAAKHQNLSADFCLITQYLERPCEKPVKIRDLRRSYYNINRLSEAKKKKKRNQQQQQQTV